MGACQTCADYAELLKADMTEILEAEDNDEVRYYAGFYLNPASSQGLIQEMGFYR